MYRQISQVYVSQFGCKLLNKCFFKSHKVNELKKKKGYISDYKSNTHICSVLIFLKIYYAPCTGSSNVHTSIKHVTAERSDIRRMNIWFIIGTHIFQLQTHSGMHGQDNMYFILLQLFPCAFTLLLLLTFAANYIEYSANSHWTPTIHGYRKNSKQEKMPLSWSLQSYWIYK